MDWSKFDLAMTDPQYQSGEPVLKADPRMPVQTILDNLDDGMTPQAISQAWHVELSLVSSVQRFVESQRLARSVR